MKYLKREDIYEYVKKRYGTVPEYLWKDSPKSAVLRHRNGKWYGVLMEVERSRLGLEGDTKADIIHGQFSDTELRILTGISYE